MMKQEEAINYLSEFIEKPEDQIFGFTLTYISGVIENHFVAGNVIEISDKIGVLKKMYENLKEKKEALNAN